ncbi:hypothetical protein QLQ12_28975 [Actinoplanes sp. NEAU-A12]|uniref:Uncharacterized protein n=1 Tax=Actinoplanes sandaracinus TaxID=3045177 RepID=A0ABT6WSI2_9ACTN|nr:hypothetical protein [Actinoplanes sandaracinus]MDI6102659.1 hypothetical protein [Actinoplanes sandaracinus]
MPLNGAQVAHLAQVIDEQWNLATLELFARDRLDVDLANLKPDGSVKERALALINFVNSEEFPPRDEELLRALISVPNARLRAVATEFLRPSFLSLNGSPLGAIVVGRAAFVDRGDLRQVLDEFVNPNPNTTHVLIIRGAEPGGKSYTYTFLRHLAVSAVGAHPKRLRLSGTAYTPRMFFEQVFRLLDLDLDRLPRLADDPQAARIDALVAAFDGQVTTGLRQRYWLVIDDLNDATVTPEVREAAYALAFQVEESRPENLWVALLGYNAEITDPELLYVAQEDARFPTEDQLAEHFRCMSSWGPNPLTPVEARKYARTLLSEFPHISKEAMTRLSPRIDVLGEKLRRGERIEPRDRQ